LPEGDADWLAVNAERVPLYGRIGRDILQRQ